MTSRPTAPAAEGPPPGMPERIRARLQVLEPTDLAIDDDSARHAGHEGAKSGGGHYRVRIVSQRFAGLPRLARHRLVYDALGPLGAQGVHALAIVAQAPDDD